MELIKCPSKINLFLIVFQKKSKSNLHKIDSLFYRFNDISDTLNIKELFNTNKDEISYFMDDKKIDISNCILKKTLDLLREKKITKKYYQIKIIKNIPIGAGLGGASSNAASLIKYICNKEKVKISKIKKLILEIGSDVMFFIKDLKFARVKGYGEKIKKINLDHIDIEIILTNFFCSTKMVYDCFDKYISNNKKITTTFGKQLSYLKQKKYELLVNDLKEPCFLVFPNFKKVYNSIDVNKTLLLSGSGSTIFYFK